MSQPNRRLVSPCAAAALVVLLAGCGHKDGTIQPEGKPSATAAVIDAPHPTTPVEAPPDKPAPVERLPVELSPEKLTLHVFHGDLKKGSYPTLRVFPVGDRMVVGPGARVLSEGRIVDTPGITEVEIKGEDRNGGEETKFLADQEIENASGRYPDEIWLDVSGAWGRVTPRGYADTYAERRYTYLRQFGTLGRVPDQPIGAWPWSKRRTLAYLGGGRFRLALTNRQKPDPLPRQQAGKSCPVRIDGKAMMALPSGKVAVLGPDCDSGGALALEVWGPGSDEESLSKSEIVALPGALPSKLTAAWVLLGENVTYVAAQTDASPYLAEIRVGKATEIAAPETHITGAHMAPDGTLFVAGESNVYRHDGIADRKARFTAAELPKGLLVKKQFGLFAESRDHVYWAVTTEKGSVILSTHEAPAPAAPASPSAPSAAPSIAASAAPSIAASAAPAASAASSVAAAALMDAFPALTDACTTPLVVLFPVAKSTPRDFDYAAAKADLKDYPGATGLKLVEIEKDGERFLAAVVKDAKAAKELITYLTAKNKDAAPKAACYAAPATAREIH